MTVSPAARSLSVIAHVDDPSIGVLSDSAAAAGWTIDIVRPFRGEVPPAVDELTALVVLGGPQSAYDTRAHPFLAGEIDYLAKVHEHGVPLLALCLGSHLLADALGGRSEPGASGLECGFIDVTATTGTLPVAGRYFSFHSDTAVAPGGAALLATSGRYVQAWRLDRSVAIQFHPELDAEGVDALLALEGPKLADFGIDAEAIRGSVGAELTPPLPGRRLLDAWFAEFVNRT
ncbi:type 1 glutamine amidotransferase [Gordonia sp. NPDC003504]